MEETTTTLTEETVEQKVEETPKADVATMATPVEGAKKTCCGGGSCKERFKKHGLLIAVIVFILIVGGSYAYKTYRLKVDIGPDAVKVKIQKFIDANVPAGTKVDIKSVTKEADLYKITVDANGQEIPLYMTRDGKNLIQQLIDIDKASQPADTSSQQATPEKTQAEQTSDVPTVDLFVMSYCPYGLQMERGILPAIEALGSKIKFNLKFVSYTLHGPKEVAENVNQYCIEKTQQPKLDSYLKCFWKNSAGDSATCMKAVGINTAQVATCVADANKQFNPTEKDFSINKDENVKFGVQGSPTLVVNGTTVSSGRDSASILKAICSGFANAPKECNTKLSAAAPSAGFDDQASGGGSSAPASCATPAK